MEMALEDASQTLQLNVEVQDHGIKRVHTQVNLARRNDHARAIV